MGARGVPEKSTRSTRRELSQRFLETKLCVLRLESWGRSSIGSPHGFYDSCSFRIAGLGASEPRENPPAAVSGQHPGADGEDAQESRQRACSVLFASLPQEHAKKLPAILRWVFLRTLAPIRGDPAPPRGNDLLVLHAMGPSSGPRVHQGFTVISCTRHLPGVCNPWSSLANRARGREGIVSGAQKPKPGSALRSFGEAANEFKAGSSPGLKPTLPAKWTEPYHRRHSCDGRFTLFREAR